MSGSFLDDAESFARRLSGSLPFRYMRWFLRCSEDELAGVMAKVYGESVSRNWHWSTGPVSSLTAALLHPLYTLAARTVLWRRRSPVVFDLETIDQPYFERWSAGIFDSLPAPKRLTPRDGPAGLPWDDVSDGIHSTITLRSAALLFLAPLCIPWLLLMAPPGSRLHFLKAFRHALSVYAQFDGHFRRYPCRHFVTYADDSNHPSRHLAFRQNCAGILVAVQNGERGPNPIFAFGSLDLYLVFGESMRETCARARVRAGRIVPVGSLFLNEFHRQLAADPEAGLEPACDILFIDQGVAPHNGCSPPYQRAIDRVLEHLRALKSERPSLRLAYQMRYYAPGSPHGRAVEKHIRDGFGGAFTILPNPTDRGESYLNIMRAGLVVTFASSLGFEALRLGRKALFVNFSGDPAFSLCKDARFQIDDPSAGYDAFAARITGLLAAPLDEIPRAALERHFAFDGRVEERIAAAIEAAVRDRPEFQERMPRVRTTAEA